MTARCRSTATGAPAAETGLAATEGPVEVATEEAVEAATVAASEPADDAGYVPMSEWIEDFDRRA